MDKSSARLFVLHTKYLITYFYFTSITHSSIIFRINWETELLVRLELTILKRPLNNDEMQSISKFKNQIVLNNIPNPSNFYQTDSCIFLIAAYFAVTTVYAETPPTCPPSYLNVNMLPSEDCTKFYVCDHNVPLLRDCPPELHFNRVLMVCDWPRDAKCTTLTAPSNEKSTKNPATKNNYVRGKCN